MSDDLREILDPLAAVLAARPRFRQVAATTITPPVTPEQPAPVPIVTPARTEAFTAPGDLPDATVTDDDLDLGAQVALLQAAVAQLWGDLEIRTVAGRFTQTSGVYTAGASYELLIGWDSTPPRTPTGALVSIQSYIGWQGRVTAKVKAGEVSSAGCTVTVSVLNAITPDAARPITFEVSGLYFYVPAGVS